MNWKNVKLIFLREVRDQLRDRRTLFMIAVLPILLYPVLGIGMVQMTMVFTQQTRTIGILGADQLPEFCADCRDGKQPSTVPTLLKDGRFRDRYFSRAGSAGQLEIVTDLKSDDSNKASRALRGRSNEIREKLRLRESLDKDDPRYTDINSELSQLLSDAGLQVLIVVPDGFGKNLETANRKLSEGVVLAKDLPKSAGLILLRNSADEKSRIAYRRTKEALDGWEQAVLAQRLRRARLPEKLATPIAARTVEVAEKSQIAASIWSKMFPALLVIMSLTGAFYPAVDLAAGEKERGTMETLLICPASRTEIVVGKFLTVSAFSISTALLNLISMGLTGKYMLSIVGSGGIAPTGDIPAPGFGAIFWIIVLLLPLAALFSALSLAFATFARSSKEGQYYLTPMLIVIMGVTVFCLSPGVKFQPFHSIMPVMGPTLLLKELLSTSGGSSAYVYLLPVLATSLGYSLLALWWAVEQFSREDILFREAEQFNPRLWVRHLLRDKEPTPSFAEAGVCFVLIMLLQFGAMRMMRDVVINTPAAERSTTMVQLLMIQQLVIIATPAMLMGVILTSCPRKTLRLNWPSWPWPAGAMVLALTLHPLTFELSVMLQEWNFFPPLQKGMQEQVAAMSDFDQPLWFILLAFAVMPAICEEVAFRGFILSGFNRNNRAWLAIGLSSAAFGLMHMIPQQVFNAALLGLVLGLLAIRSNSLLPGILFHFTYNALSVMNGRLAKGAPESFEQGPLSWLIRVGKGSIRYEWTTLVICAVIAAIVLRRMIPRSACVLRQADSESYGSPEWRVQS